MRGAIWARALLEGARAAGGFPESVVVRDGTIAGQAYRAIAVVPHSGARFPRARAGEFGLDEGRDFLVPDGERIFDVHVVAASGKHVCRRIDREQRWALTRWS